MTTPSLVQPADDAFLPRHVGPDPAEVAEMLGVINPSYRSLDDLISDTVPGAIRADQPLDLAQPLSESAALGRLRQIAAQNKVFRSFIGQGYYGTITPPVIQRNILENPAWYTQYTPYQAEISQGRLEALLNFQTMVANLTALPQANASLLDEATAAAEAMVMAHSIANASAEPPRNSFFASVHCHPQTLAVLKTRAAALGIDLVIADESELTTDHWPLTTLFGVLLQYPSTDGRILDYAPLIERVHAAGALAIVATDLLALTLIKPPGEFGADIAIGSAQRFGVPMGYGGPHAAFMATKTEYVRKMPGRIVGVSRDATGQPAYRLALQTREQHIRRDKATSNICTAQVLLAIMASMYAVYHGPEGLKAIARSVHATASTLRAMLADLGYQVPAEHYFDTVLVCLDKPEADAIVRFVARYGANLRLLNNTAFAITVDETTSEADLELLRDSLADARGTSPGKPQPLLSAFSIQNSAFSRTSPFLTHPVFNSHHSETEMLRYIKQLESRDLSLAHSMIPLGSCTMKLNPTAAMFPISWPEFANLHPYAPEDQTAGYQQMLSELATALAKITGLPAVSLQPLAGSQGELAGLLTIRGYHLASGADALVGRPGSKADEGVGTTVRNICLIPVSAHGTNPASAVAAGFTVVPVACDSQGNIDLADLRAKVAAHADHLAALMLTYPSTHGVFEESVKDICRIIHDAGGLVYMDGANMNAMVGLSSPAALGADVCHLNLHKTFAIPHGGGGPGMAPIACTARLAAYLPKHPLTGDPLLGAPPADDTLKRELRTVVSAAPFGSAGILPIPWMYINMMGASGLKAASQIAILNANYMAARLAPHYPVHYLGPTGRCAHEFILDCHDLQTASGITVEDIAKRLMDFSFHAPTVSWPEPGTLMIEPTESESKDELDRFCDALIAIRQEIQAIIDGKSDRKDNPLKNAPHSLSVLTADTWSHPYPRSQAAFPLPYLRSRKFWPPVARIDNPYGDRHLFCTCPPYG